MNKYGLIGKNISYSISPLLHSLISEKNNLKLNYELIDINIEELSKYLNLLKEKKYKGFNVTIPYKEKIIKHLDILTLEAKTIGAVNTVYLNDEGLIVGDNTDYYGFLKLLEINDVLKDVKKAYILGTGGAAKTVFHVLNNKNIKVVNVARNKDSIEGFKDVISYLEFKEIKEVDLVVNCTPVGSALNPGLPIIKNEQTIKKVVDLTYNPLKTQLMELAIKSVNGLDMLIFQAIKSQSIWQNKEMLEKDNFLLFSKIKEALINEFIW